MLLHNAMPQQLKNPPAMQETQEMQVQSLGQDNSLGQEDLLEEGMATHSSILACRIPIDGGAWRATVYRVAQSRTQLSD